LLADVPDVAYPVAHAVHDALVPLPAELYPDSQTPPEYELLHTPPVAVVPQPVEKYPALILAQLVALLSSALYVPAPHGSHAYVLELYLKPALHNHCAVNVLFSVYDQIPFCHITCGDVPLTAQP
jgi:hypothetical protein